MNYSRSLWPLAVANLVANIGIVVTGGAVRLTGSGLGCPTWPRCTDDSYVAHPALGLHGAVEFGNRMLTWVLVVLAVAFVVAAWRSRLPKITRIAVLVALAVPLQAVIGGITVLTDLNPWVVALHFLASMVMIGVCTYALDVLRGPDRAPAATLVRRVALATFAVLWVTLYLGTVVTGSGPHSGDLDSRRNGLDPETVSRVHALVVYVLVALVVALLVLTRRTGARVATRAATLLLVVTLLQGVIGYVQYFNDLPELLVATHMLGAALLSAAGTWAVLSTRAAPGLGARA